MMRFAMLASASAMALVFAGSVSAADQFTTLKGVKAIQMSATELSAVKGMDHHFFVTPPGTGEAVRHDTDQHQSDIQDATGTQTTPGDSNFVVINRPGDNALRAAAPGYLGLIFHACQVSGGVITGPSTNWC